PVPRRRGDPVHLGEGVSRNARGAGVFDGILGASDGTKSLPSESVPSERPNQSSPRLIVRRVSLPRARGGRSAQRSPSRSPNKTEAVAAPTRDDHRREQDSNRGPPPYHGVEAFGGRAEQSRSTPCLRWISICRTASSESAEEIAVSEVEGSAAIGPLRA